MIFPRRSLLFFLVLAVLTLFLGLPTDAQESESPEAGTPAETDSSNARTLASTTAASGTVRNSGTNPSVFSLILPPVVGGVMLTQLDVAGSGYNVGVLFAYLSPANIVIGGGQTLLVNIADPSGPATPLLAVDLFSGLTAFPIPNNPSLCGIQVYMQGFMLNLPPNGVPYSLSNALDLVLGV